MLWVTTHLVNVGKVEVTDKQLLPFSKLGIEHQSKYQFLRILQKLCVVLGTL
jgi:hypothetical protein